MVSHGILKRFAPPILTELVRAQKLYPTWDAAKKAADSYDKELVNRFRVDRSTNRPADGSLLPGNLLYLTTLALTETNLKITDMGGATGELGEEYLARFPESEYVVVENSTLIGMMADRGRLQFRPVPPTECDVFFSSSTLQYLDNPMTALEAGFRAARSAVILVRNSFCDRELIRVQKSWLFDNGNGPVPPGYSNVEISYPHRTIDERAVHKCAKAQGFHCVARIEEISGVFPYGNAVYGRQLAFIRNR